MAALTTAAACWAHLAPRGPGVPPSLAVPHTRGPWVALTFDDGPAPAHTEAVLDALAEAGVRATFFVLGVRARTYPSLVARIVSEGHSLGLHGDRHDPVVLRSSGWLSRELAAARMAVLASAPLAAVRWYRPPWGIRRPGLCRALRQRGLHLVLWDVDSRDYAARGADAVLQRVVGGARPGRVILLHDAGPGASLTAAALPRVLAALKERQLECRSLDDVAKV